MADMASIRKQVGELVNARLEELAEPDAPVAERQLALLPVAVEPEGVPNPDAERRAGRPTGSLNKTTIARLDYWLSKYRHPVETLLDIQSRNAHILAAELGCDPKEALAIIVAAADKAAPYTAQRLPPAEAPQNADATPLQVLTRRPEIDKAQADRQAMLSRLGPDNPEESDEG